MADPTTDNKDTATVVACTGCGKCNYCTARGITVASLLGLEETALTTAQRITTSRVQIGLTQEALATRLGVTQATVSRWESNLREPHLSNIMPLADALGVTVESLLPGTQPITRNLSEQQIHALLTLLRDTTSQLERLIT